MSIQDAELLARPARPQDCLALLTLERAPESILIRWQTPPAHFELETWHGRAEFRAMRCGSTNGAACCQRRIGLPADSACIPPRLLTDSASSSRRRWLA